MRDSGSLGIEEVKKQGGLDKGTTLGCCFMILIIQYPDGENMTV